jgi:hypothetical protein
MGLPLHQSQLLWQLVQSLSLMRKGEAHRVYWINTHSFKVSLSLYPEVIEGGEQSVYIIHPTGEAIPFAGIESYECLILKAVSLLKRSFIS